MSSLMKNLCRFVKSVEQECPSPLLISGNLVVMFSEQRLVCINYSLHKVGLHLRGDKHFEILYQCIQTLQNSLRMYELHDEVLSSS